MRKCPICSSENQDLVFTTDLPEKTDTDIILPYYSNYTLYQCNTCTHYYVYLKPEDEKNLEKYYNNRADEYSDGGGEILPFLYGDYPGSENPESIKRYNFMYDSFLKDIDKTLTVLDFGCNQGGFLGFLSKKGFNNLIGVDLDDSAINYARLKYGNSILFESVSYLEKLEDGSIDLIIIDQVMEHIANPINLINWLTRLLKINGHFVISVPNILDYANYEAIPFQHFMFLEHIHHYTPTSLEIAFEKFTKKGEWFFHVSGQPNYTLPIIASIFKKGGSEKIWQNPNIYKLNHHKNSWICREKINTFLEKVNKKLIENKNRPMIFWGASREMCFLFFRLLKEFREAFLVDRNPKKQGKKIAGFNIVSPEELFCSNPNFYQEAIIFISAVGYENQILKDALQLGFSRDRIICPSKIWREENS